MSNTANRCEFVDAGYGTPSASPGPGDARGCGTVYPVNPKRPSVLGIRAYAGIQAVPEAVDLAVIVTPAPAVPAVVGACIDAGVKAAPFASQNRFQPPPAVSVLLTMGPWRPAEICPWTTINGSRC